ncbi:MAG: hypothetical protein HZA53_14940 [Planctomycetes bacterium]|nr:hypothetical protein [Planctomycetota bacterium]
MRRHSRSPLLLLAVLLGAVAARAQLPGVVAPKGSSAGGSSFQGGGGSNGGGGTSGGSTATPPAPEDKTLPVDPKAPPAKNAAKSAASAASEPRPKDSPRTPAAEGDDRSGWETWWLFNRDALLDLRAPAPPASPEATAVGRPLPRRGAVTAKTVDLRVLPALARLFERESNPELLAELVFALARSAPRENGLEKTARVALVERALAHPDARVSEAAALALGLFGSGSAAEPLLELARDTKAGRALCARDSVPYRVRAHAAYSAGLLAAEAPNEDVRRFAVEGLVRLAAQRDTPREVAVACVNALGIVPLAADAKAWKGGFERTARELEPTAAREALAAHLAQIVQNDRTSPVLRAHALTAIARLARGACDGLHDAVERLCIDLLAPAERAPNELAQSAVLALAELSDAGAAPQDKEARAQLAIAARDADLDTRHFALLALGRIAARPDEDVGAPFAGTGETHRFLLRELADGRGATRAFAALALGLYGRALRDAGRTSSGEAAELLRVRLAKTSSPDEAAACALALGLRADAGTAELLTSRLAEAADDATRAACCIALGLADAESALPVLRRALIAARARPALVREAAVGLALLNDAELTPELVAELRGASGSAAEYGLMQALAVVGDERALDVLFELANDAERSSGLRARAVSTIGAIADARRLPWNDALARGANYLAAAETLSDARGTGVIDRR